MGVFKGVTQERREKTQKLIRCIGIALGLRDQYTNDEELDELMAKVGSEMSQKEMMASSFTSRPWNWRRVFDLCCNDLSEPYRPQLLGTQP